MGHEGLACVATSESLAASAAVHVHGRGILGDLYNLLSSVWKLALLNIKRRVGNESVDIKV